MMLLSHQKIMILFKTIKWKNFLSTGVNYTEVDLTHSKSTIILGANGAGKSTILDALTFALFARPFRKINKPQLVNSINQTDCMVEINFDVGKNKYKVVRGIKPNKFEIYQNGIQLDQDASVVDQQKHFEQTILKMNYKSFTQIVVLGSSTFVPFMRLPLAARREIIEDILDIQIFSTMNVNLKEKTKIINDQLKDHEYKFLLIKEKIDMQKQFMLDIEKKNKEDIQEKENRKDTLLCEALNHETEILNNNQTIDIKTAAVSNTQTLKATISKVSSIQEKLATKRKSHTKEKKFFEENDACPTCGQSIEEHFKQEKISLLSNKLAEVEKGVSDLGQQLSDLKTQEDTFILLIDEIKELNLKNRQLTNDINSLHRRIEELDNDIGKLRDSNVNQREQFSILKSLNESSKQAQKTISETKEEKDCFATAAQLLKDSGIKTRIIKKYLPTMNKLINDYLEKMEFASSFTLDENFEEVIKSRYRDEFSYESFSEGEKARIDIALLLTWRSVAKLKNSVDTNLLILDEIFDGSLDQSGNSDLGWILKTFDDKTNVFVISHRDNMADKFDRCLRFEKHKNYSYVTDESAE
jgi:DNA repair exonuclease SbcCD ATPase subunit